MNEELKTKKENIIKQKSFQFALEIIEVYKYLSNKKREYVLSKQLLRSGTSIGANVEEAIAGRSRKDFLYKMNIALKEARETNYWLRLLKASGYINGDNLINQSIEIRKILTSIVKTITINYIDD
ncbi:MAG: four helix bundle protein [bacterium]